MKNHNIYFITNKNNSKNTEQLCFIKSRNGINSSLYFNSYLTNVAAIIVHVLSKVIYMYVLYYDINHSNYKHKI